MNALSPQSAEALLGSTALSAIGPDAELIAACARFCELERAWVDAGAGGIEFDSPEEAVCDAERDRIKALQDPVTDRILDLPCTTLPGFRAIAGALATWDQELLKDGPGDLGAVLTSKLVSEILATPSAPEADADLIALSAEFCRLMEDLGQTDFDATSRRRVKKMEAEQKRIIGASVAIAERMDRMQATTGAGLIARAAAMAAHDADHVFCWDSKGTTARGMLDALLRDAAAMRLSAPTNPDADLLALRPEYERLYAEIDAENARAHADGWDDDEEFPAFKTFDTLCERIIKTPPAATRAGRALKAIALMHQLTYVCADQDDEDGALGMCWTMLEQEVGGEFALPGAQP